MWKPAIEQVVRRHSAQIPNYWRALSYLHTSSPVRIYPCETFQIVFNFNVAVVWGFDCEPPCIYLSHRSTFTAKFGEALETACARLIQNNEGEPRIPTFLFSPKKTNFRTFEGLPNLKSFVWSSLLQIGELKYVSWEKKKMRSLFEGLHYDLDTQSRLS